MTIPGLCLLAAIMLLASVHPASAQHDTRGRKFWVAFLANLGSEMNETSDLRIYLSSEYPTTAKVVYHGRPADTLVVPLPVPRTSVEVDISARFGDVELGMGEEFSRKGIEVLADSEITLYGVNIRWKSADAFLGLPDDVLTGRYIVLAYPNALDESGEYDQPSQFAVVATEDGTTIRIDPSADMPGRGRNPYVVMLDRGQVYFGQAQTGEPNDVSGTEIRANKPVAVFAGNRRTSIPLSVGNFRDHLVEQMPPLEVWGNDAVATPHYPVWTGPNPYTAVVRVLAAFDNTDWWIDGIPQGTLARARSVEIPLLRSMHITASAPILVAQYEHSVAAYDASSDPGPGDPFMMIVAPTEQFDTSYSFQSINHREFYPQDHFINVVMPTNATASLSLDGQLVPATWSSVPQSNLSFAQINVRPGSHYIKADSAFGLYCYGFGAANSYGYTGGMLFRTLVHDFEPPEIEQKPTCDGAAGIAFDSRITDTGIDSVLVLNRSKNVTVTIDPFRPPTDTVRYSATLNDPFQDGVVAIKAIDSMGRSRTEIDPIPGFTVRTVGMTTTPIQVDTVSIVNGARQCFTIELENYGQFPQRITSLDLKNALPGTGSGSVLPFTIPPGARVSVELCMQSPVDTMLLTELIVGNSCRTRSVALIPVVTWTDSLPPRISRVGDDCSPEVAITIAEPGRRNSGIVRYQWIRLENAQQVSSIPDSNALPSDRLELRIRQLDPMADAAYELRVVDMAGNVTTYVDTISGFTLTVLGGLGDTLGTRTGLAWVADSMTVGQERCDSMTLNNYGTRQIVLGSVFLKGNVGFSIPASQLPLTVPAHSSRRLIVCMEGAGSGRMRDTLVLADLCGRGSELVMSSAVGSQLLGSDVCANTISISTIGATKRTFLATPVPNPATGASAYVDIGLAADAPVDLDIFDANGVRMETILSGADFGSGIHRISFDISRLPSGSYLCRLGTGGPGVYQGRMIVVH